MSVLGPVLILICCGCMISVQATLNVPLGRAFGIWVYPIVFTLVQLVLCLPAGWLSAGGGLASTLSGFGKLPWWAYIGGALGLPILVGMAFSFAKTGTFVGLVALLVGQLAMGLLIDQFGLFGAPVNPVTFSRVLGLGLVMTGVFLAKQ